MEMSRPECRTKIHKQVNW